MRDVSAKITTLRTATAKAVLHAEPDTIRAVVEGRVPKGDPLPVAKVAAIQAAKETPRAIPYCHPLPIDWVGVEFDVRERQIECRVSVRVIHKTGVEMEALHGATVAVLTIYDMLKMLDEKMWIDGVELLSKRGGKSDFASGDGVRAAVITLSDRVAAGQAQDRSGPLLVERLETAGVGVIRIETIADEPAELETLILHFADEQRLDLVLTTGGTGIGPRDTTPETIAKLLDREIPGIAEAMRSYGQARLPTAMLSRSIAGMRGNTLIAALPGSAGGVADAMDALLPGLLHAIEIARGGDH
ncbi:bifunctional molybdenum cofactor biosynthesis protein MoaC/MoaB [Rhodospirillales bacterium TMPK1]|uniref:Molybdopterin adenylyltransferase n=1 Tax=Roseiterribacter gracilis TaxID=2812848 RepID=A0A8S8XKP2_9PROT|nr:bifunctional molybdenum cofactor biosynthesis protein MoaC/MoaB [Rhodospirillales bacterium TMPK1]